MLTVRRIDYLGPAHTDPERTDGVCFRLDADGFLHADARLTRTGVFSYADSEGNTWGELRTEDQVFDAATLRSFRLKTVTDDHPPDFVTARNVRDVQVGTVGTDVRKDGRYMRASIVITDQNVIRSVQDGKIELSCGYEADVIQDAGTADGVSYAARQTNIRGNHVALVSQGRAGSSCALLVGRGDAFSITTERIPMLKKIKIDGVEFEVDAKLADAIEAKAKADEAAAAAAPAPTPAAAGTPAAAPAVAAPAPAQAAGAAAQPVATESSDELAKLNAKIDGMVADRAGESARFDHRVSLVTDAREVLGKEAAITGIADSTLMRQVVLAVRPGMEAKLDANKASAGYLQHAYEDAVERHRTGNQHVQDTSVAMFGAHNTATQSKEDAADEEAKLDAAINSFMTGQPAVAAGAGV
jgi:hypothetical protein